jgi:transposase
MDILPNIRQLIITNFTSGMNISQISRSLHVSRRSCRRIINLQQTTGGTTSKRSNCGGHNRLHPRTERILTRASLRYPRATSRELAHIAGGPALEIDTSTIRRSLRRNGIQTYRPSKSPFLMPAQCRTRAEWARKHRHWTTTEWSRIVFSDETAVSLCQPRSQFVHRRKNQRITQQHITPHRPFVQKVMFWGCISVFGPGPLIPIVGTMNSNKYLDILEQHLFTYCDVWFPDGYFQYQQDNAPCHKARTVQHFFTEKNIDVLQWPPYSPDLNCIENIWALLKQKLHLSQYRTKEELISTAINIWENDSSIREACVKVILSMPSRINECISSRGEYTHY